MWPYWTLGLLIIALFGLAAEIVKLVVGGWTKLTVSLIAIVNVVTTAYFVSLLTIVDPIANPAMLQLVAESLNRPDITSSVVTGIAVFVIIIIAMNIWEVAEAVYKYKRGGKK